MTRTKEEALANVALQANALVLELVTIIDLEIDKNYDGVNPASVSHPYLQTEATRTAVQELYEGVGWSVTMLQDTPDPGEWTIELA